MININNENGRVFDVSVELKDNAMLKVRPDLFDEWDFVKNDELGLDIYKVTKGTNKIAWWICLDCESSYDISPKLRCNQNQNCPYCRGYRVNHTNSLSSLAPNIASQWHPERNENKTPHDVTCSSNQKVWWIGECGHEWKTAISHRYRGRGCPYCTASNPKTIKGFNDMWTTNPMIAKLLLNPEDGFKYSNRSNKKVDWKCPCGEIIKNKSVNDTQRRGLSCPICSDGFSYPSKLMYSLLKELNIEFEWEKSFDWLNGKRFDFYLSSYDLIIEMHGGQHYERGFENMGGRTLEEEQENDRYKRKIALANKIENYVEIDSRKSEFEFIKRNIINSDLTNIFDLSNVDWDKVYMNSLKSFKIEIISLWNKGENKKGIMKELKVSKSTVDKVLRNHRKTA